MKLLIEGSDIVYNMNLVKSWTLENVTNHFVSIMIDDIRHTIHDPFGQGNKCETYTDEQLETIRSNVISLLLTSDARAVRLKNLVRTVAGRLK